MQYHNGPELLKHGKVCFCDNDSQIGLFRGPFKLVFGRSVAESTSECQHCAGFAGYKSAHIITRRKAPKARSVSII